jgi:hypothetical protein
MNELANFIYYQKEVFRIFSTAHPSQELLDDLLPKPSDQNLIKPLYYPEEIPQELTATQRVIRYSENQEIQQEISAKFNPKNWYRNRFSAGTWRVLYSAESTETSLKESLYHKRNFYSEELNKKPISIDLRLIKLKVESNQGIDLTSIPSLDQNQLTSKDESGYPYCQNLAKHFLLIGTQLFRTFSARDKHGICTPIFDLKAVQKDYGHLRYYKSVLSKEVTEVFEER